MNDTSAQVAALLAKYTPAIATQMTSCREKLARTVPRGFELVYDNYNTLAFGFSLTDRASDAVISIAAYPRWITLFFLHGAKLKDPGKLLQGTGVRVRSIRLASPDDLDSIAIQRLMAQALQPHAAAFAAAPPLATVVKSVSARQRPRRPATNN